MGFVDDRIFPSHGRMALFTPGEGFIDNHRFRHSARIVATVEREVRAGAAGAITEMRVAPHQPPSDPFGIRIDEELVRIEAESVLGIVSPVHPVAVELAWDDIVEIAVPNVLGAFGQRNALDLASTLSIEQTKLDPFGVGREQRKIGATSVPGGAKRMRQSGRKSQFTGPERGKLQP